MIIKYVSLNAVWQCAHSLSAVIYRTAKEITYPKISDYERSDYPSDRTVCHPQCAYKSGCTTFPQLPVGLERFRNQTCSALSYPIKLDINNENTRHR